MTSPTQRTLKLLRSEGYQCEISEHFNPWSKTKKDLFGFIDLVALKCPSILAVQTTSAPNHSSRRSKILSLASARQWLVCGGEIELISWRKNAKGRWTPRREQIGLADFLRAAPLERP